MGAGGAQLGGDDRRLDLIGQQDAPVQLGQNRGAGVPGGANEKHAAEPGLVVSNSMSPTLASRVELNVTTLFALFRSRTRGCCHSMLAVIFDIWFRSQGVGDLFLRTRRDGLVDLELWDGRLTRAGNVVLRGMFEVDGHGESFGR